MTPEEVTIRAFVDTPQRARYLALLADPRKRRELTARFYHRFSNDVDVRWAHTVDRSVAPSEVAGELLRRGAPLIASIFGGEFDGTVAPLLEALSLIDLKGGAIVICIPGRLARYVGEPPDEPTYILDRGHGVGERAGKR